MKNITHESYAITSNEAQKEQERNAMPTVKDFASAKISEGFNFLGKKFGQGSRIVGLKKDLLVAESALSAKLARQIGLDVIDRVAQGERHIKIPPEVIAEIVAHQEKIANIKNELAHA